MMTKKQGTILAVVILVVFGVWYFIQWAVVMPTTIITPATTQPVTVNIAKPLNYCLVAENPKDGCICKDGVNTANGMCLDQKGS